MFGLNKLLGFSPSPSAAPAADDRANAAPPSTVDLIGKTFHSADEPRALISVLTKKRGLLTSIGLGHNLQLSFPKFDAVFDGVGSLASVECDLTSIAVDASVDETLSKRLGPVSAANQKEILENTQGAKVLDVQQHPRAVFRPTEVSASGITGDLELHGVTKAIACDAISEPSSCGRDLLFAQLEANGLASGHADSVRWFRCRVHTPDFGIAPFSAAAGMLALEPHVVVEAAVPTVPLSR